MFADGRPVTGAKGEIEEATGQFIASWNGNLEREVWQGKAYQISAEAIGVGENGEGEVWKGKLENVVVEGG